MEKRNNIIILILTLLVIGVSVVAIYIWMDFTTKTHTLNEEIEKLSNKTINEFNVENATSNKDTSNALGTTDVSSETKVINTKLNIAQKLQNNEYISREMDNMKLKIKDGKVYTLFTSSSIGTGTYKKELNKYYEISNVSGKVIDAVITKIPTSGYPIIVMLMEDGSLQKTKFAQGDDIVCEGKISGYENIIGIEKIEYEEVLNFGDNSVTKLSNKVVAMDKNGNISYLSNLW